MGVLESLSLHNLVESEIPRPFPDSPQAERWFTLSKTVRAWLASSVEPHIVTSIQTRGEATAFADKFMEFLRIDFRGTGPSRMSDVFMTIRDIRRSSYTTTKAFIKDVQYWNLQGTNVGLDMNPYYLMMIIMHELGTQPHLESFMKVKLAQFHDRGCDAVRNYTMDNFLTDCRSILDRVAPMEKRAGFVGVAAAKNAHATSKPATANTTTPIPEQSNRRLNTPSKRVRTEDLGKEGGGSSSA